MARPIEATPVLKGKDAREFLTQTRLSEPVSADRMRWLDKLANESKSAESHKREHAAVK